MPTDPLRLRVLQALQAKLQAINGAPAYHYTVKAASVVLDPAVNLLTIPPTELPFLIVEPTPEGSKFYMPAMRLRHQFQVAITARADAPAGQATDRKSITWERLIADLEVALTQDITLGGLCVDVRLLEATPGFDLGAPTTVVVVQPLVATLIRSYGSPQGA